MFLPDTYVVSELRRPRSHGAVLAWLQGTPDAFYSTLWFPSNDTQQRRLALSPVLTQNCITHVIHEPSP
jgi:hypothetical protein